MRLQFASADSVSPFQSPAALRDDLSDALVEALFELEMLPEDREGALIGLHAIMEDVKQAIRRMEGRSRS